MRITWFGHSCFLLEDSHGNRLLTDPFDDSIGYSIPNEAVDVVTVSHHHFDHDCTNQLPGIPKIIDKIDNSTISNIRIRGIHTYHDKHLGTMRGDNIVFLIEMDGLNICHMGDLGHKLSDDIIKEIGNVDLLMIPVGGNFTIDGEEAAEIALNIHSHIVIPMHYGTKALSFPLEGAEKFIMKMGNSERINDSCYGIQSPLSDYNRVIILKYKSEL